MSTCKYPAIVCRRYKLCAVCYRYVENRFKCRAPNIICSKPLKCDSCMKIIRNKIPHEFSNYELVKYYNKLYNPCRAIKNSEEKARALDFYYNKGYTCCSLYFKYAFQYQLHIESHEDIHIEYVENSKQAIDTPPNQIDQCTFNCFDYKKENKVDYCQNTMYVGSQEISIRDIFKTDEEIKKCLERKFKCAFEGCDKAYTSQHGLRYHINNGHKENIDYNKKYVCKIPKCNNRYKNPGGLKYHLKHAHGINKKN